MQQSKLRRQIAWEAARLMYSREEAEYYRAKQKAAHRICQGWVKPADLPLDKRLANYIIDGSKDGLIADLELKRAEGAEPLDIVNGPLMAMRNS